ncbi:class I SAM-dependent methyltransferase [Gordonia aquimaris]|uniref:Methyltransferase domain-containing protein n=1 Tax=Gordonia aquimaris TaxID=2984863 RepID=A0A9X3D211_9ACTN|nr:class I SAM-dependent methyltransferase [Gordonia aquimaris]MCX2963321.1 methyltransferase domain-containing protein [Gordonia aquimaris]
MTQSAHPPHTGHHPGHDAHRRHGHHHSAHAAHTHDPATADAMAEGMAEVLDLDAAASGGFVDELAERIADLIAAPRSVVDLGSGTGGLTARLAARFPSAQVTALDNAPDMLDRVRDAARAAGVGDRVRTQVADLDTALPGDLADLDVVWSSSAMHHFAAPADLLGNVHAAVRPGGLLIVVELDGLPAFLPPDTPDGQLERRLHTIMTERGANAHPDWSPVIVGAGFDLLETHAITNAPAPPDLTSRYAHAWISRMAHGLAEELSDTDRSRLDDLLAPAGPSSLGTREDLTVRTRRTAWIARRPEHNQEKP